MRKYSFNLIDRKVLYEVYHRKCFYCNELVYFTELHIDHIIPENLLSKPIQFDSIKRKYELSNDFDINSYYNWVPCHSNCNKRKGGELFSKATTLFYLELTKRKIPMLIKH